MKTHLKAMIYGVIVCMFLPLAFACGDNANNQNINENEIEASEKNRDISADAGLRENTPDSLPGDLNFNGAEIRILHREQTDPLSYWGDEIAVESEIGEIVNDALYHRNRKVEERLNVKIAPASLPGGWDDRDNFLKTVRNSVNSGSDDYDVIAGYAYYISTLAPEGMLYNLKDVNYLEPGAEWWSAACAEEMTVDGKLYYITGDFAITLLRNMFVFYFNKQVAQDIGMENLYQIVLDGEFTLGKVEELIRGVHQDLNVNGKADGGDMYGFATTTGNHVDAMFNTFDQPIVRKDSEGVPQLAMNTPKMIEMVDRIYSFFYENENSYAISEYDAGNEDSILNMFTENRTLFMTGSIATSERLRNMNSDYGILPCPKWNSEQPAYYTTSQDSYSLFSIPVTCAKLDAAGAAMEALCAESYRTVTPAYYEIALKQKYSRDDESSQMLDLIRSGVTFDFGTVNSINMENVNKIFRDLMTEKKTDFVSRYEKAEPRFQRALDKLIDSYQNLP